MRDNGVPGPGNYNPNYRVATKELPHFSMKGRHDDLKKLTVPGPGTYERNDGIAQLPKSLSVASLLVLVKFGHHAFCEDAHF